LLLLVLASAAAVASLLPQRSVAPRTVAAWRAGAEGPGRDAAQVLDAMGLFDITGSWWWALLVALVVTATCWWLVIGWRVLARDRAGPPPCRGFGPSTTGTVRRTVAADPAAVVRAAEALLRGLGYRVWEHGRDEPRTVAERARDEPRAVAERARDAPRIVAERGRFHAVATLASHAGVPLLLLGLVTAHAFAFAGQVDLVEGDRVVETPVAYDAMEHGPLWRASDHRGFALTLDDFDVAFHPDGTPDDFVSTVRIDDDDPAQVRINHPLRTHGMMISLLRYGVAPHLWIRDHDSGAVHFDAPLRLAEAERAWAGTARLHAEGTYILDAALVPADGSGRAPQGAVPADPVLLVDVFAAGADGARGALVDQIAAPVGATVPALDGALDVGVADVSMWAGFQVSHPAGRRLMLAGAGLLLLGLTGSLWTNRRRVWLQLAPAAGGTTVALTTATREGHHTAHATSRALTGALCRRLEGGS
jgi:cytochrome c biogenesis protein